MIICKFIFSILSKTENNRDYVFVARERILSAKSYQAAAAMKGCLKALEAPLPSSSGRRPKEKE